MGNDHLGNIFGTAYVFLQMNTESYRLENTYKIVKSNHQPHLLSFLTRPRPHNIHYKFLGSSLAC